MLILNATMEKGANEDGSIKIWGYASTAAVDRAKDIILPSAWTNGLKNYEKNPILLFNHKYDEPIGKATIVEVDSNGLKIEGVIYEGTKAYTLVKNGVLKTFSVGFIPKDAEYDDNTDGFIIKQAELLEVSVVSVPCNQDATFELSKSYNESEFRELKKQFSTKSAAAPEEPKMTEEEKKAAAEAAKKEQTAAVEKAVAEALKKQADDAAAAAKAEEAKKVEVATITAQVKSETAETVTAAIKSAMEEGTLAKTVAEMQDVIKNYGEEIQKFNERNTEGFFLNKGSNTDWATNKELANQVVDAFILAKATKSAFENTSLGKEVIEKVNAFSSVQVSSARFEELVSTSLERDIEHQLIMKPMFKELMMKSASQVLSIAPQFGYATHQNANQALPGTAPNGLLTEKDGSAPVTLSEVTLRTDKLVSKAFLGNDTEEDAIMPILPIIREGMIMQHARGVDQMILYAGVVGSIYPNMTSKGLIKYAVTNGTEINGPSIDANAKVTGLDLFHMRRAMGIYGMNSNDIVFVVSQDAYFDLVEDPEWQDYDQVNNQSNKLTGEVGRIYNTRVVVSGEFQAKAAGKHAALALNTRNFVVPRLRGYTYEQEYSVDNQHLLMATTQRLGFSEIIPGAKSVAALKYVA